MKNLISERYKVALVIAAIIFGLALLVDPPYSVEGRYPGVIVVSYPMGRFPANTITALVRLPNGDNVMANISVNTGVLYKPGTPVSVTVLESLVFHHRSYVAQLEQR